MEPADQLRERLKSIPDPVELLEGIFAYAPVGFQIYTAEGRSVLTNQAFRDMFGSEPPPEYNVLEDEIARETGVLDLIRRAFGGETIHTPPIWYDPREIRQVHVEEGRRVAMESTFFPLVDRSGNTKYVAIVFKDVTAEHLAREHAEAQRQKAEEAERRTRVLSDAGAVLVGKLDCAAALDEVARLVVGALGDFCAIDVLEGESWRRAAVAQESPEPRRWIEPPPSPSAAPSHPATTVVCSGEPELILATQDEQRQSALLRELRLSCLLTVPLQSQGRSLGALSLARDTSHPAYSTAEVELACELGRRVASAIAITHLYEQAQDAIRARDEFFSIASHELKTPLTPLQLQIEMLQLWVRQGDGPHDERVPARLAQVRRQVERLSRLVENLLDVSRISVGRLSLEREQIDLAKLAREVVERFADEARRARCPFQVNARAAVVGHWDRLRLEQVLSNLLSNAFKYAAGGAVEVAVAAAGGFARLTVQDHGIGISASDAERIFERFERAVPKDQPSGLGLGLYITRQIVEAHGGSIAVESSLGSGATFIVLLPLTSTAEAGDE